MVGKATKNRRNGFSFERRRLSQAYRDGGHGTRFYASKGIVDIIYIDRDGVSHLEQLKYSSVGKARISTSELRDLCRFARRWQGCNVYVSLVLKDAYRIPEVYHLNKIEVDPETITLKQLRSENQ